MLCGSLLLLAGCRDTLEATVTGELTLGGEPVPFAQILFHPDGKGPLPYGVSLEDGSYKILTGTKSGLPAGNYTVVVQGTSPAVTVPKEYGSVASSKLDYEVKPGKNVINIELE